MSILILAADALVVLKLLVPGDPGPSPRRQPLHIHAKAPVSAGAQARAISVETTLEAGAEGQVELKLPIGVWTIEASSSGYWSQSQVLQISSEARVERTVRFYRTGRINVPVTGTGREHTSAVVDFREAPGGSATDGIPQAFLECPIAGGSIQCSVPAGNLDFRFELNGLIPEYAWSRRVVAGADTRFPPLQFATGASVAGYVRTADGRPSIGTVVELLTLSGDQVPPAASPITHRLKVNALRSLQGTTNERGFFQVRHAPAGEYQVVAKRTGTLALTQAVVKGVGESRLRDYLTLESPLDLPVSVEPSLPPDGGLWSLRVIRLRPFRAPLYQRDVPEHRPAVVPVTKGLYSLELWKGADRWFVESVEIDGPPPPVLIRLPLTRVTGTVKIGKEPLEGLVMFGGVNGPKRVSMPADENGEFHGILPHDGDWPVAVESKDGLIQRTVARVSVLPDAAGEASVSIELADTKLRGRVVDEAGHAARAFVRVLPDGGQDRLVQLRVNPPDDSFQVRGLPEGSVRLEAHAEGNRRSDPVTVQLSEGRESEVTLVVKGERTLDGQLLSSDGTPVAGASVLAFEDRPQSSSPRYVTDAAGKFQLKLGQATRRLILVYWADGYATRLSSSPAENDLTLILDRVGGSLTLDFGREIELFDGAAPLQTVVGVDGLLLPVSLFAKVAAARGSQLDGLESPTTRAIALPHMNSGAYALCVQSLSELNQGGPPIPSKCAQGTLHAGADLRLSLPPASWPTTQQ